MTSFFSLSLSTLKLVFAINILITCGPILAKNSKYDKISGYNAPWRFVRNYTAKFEELPLEGQLEDRPWSGDYWADFLGGTSFRWYPLAKDNKDKRNPKRYSYRHPTTEEIKSMDLKNLSPIEKYDLLMGDENWTMTKTERERTGVLKTIKGHPQYDPNFKVEGWWGLCHAWAPATILYKNPAPITLKNPKGVNVPFGASDIKALLTLHMHTVPERSEEYTFLGERCFSDLKAIFRKWRKVWDQESTSAEAQPALRLKIRKGLDYDLKDLKECNDMNPGSFHIALGNSIGHKKEGFIMDKDRGGETWNQGVYGYKVNITKKRTETIKERPYTVYSIINTVQWVTEISQSWKKVKDGIGLTTTEYKYDLYLDENGNIVGGKWLTQGLMDRPDIIWMRRPRPPFQRGLKGLEAIYKNATKKPVKRFAPGELKALFKKSVKKIINANKFIKGTQELVAHRKHLREEYYKNLKKAVAQSFFDEMKKKDLRDKKILEAIKPKIERARKKIQERNSHLERRPLSKTDCLYGLISRKGRLKQYFKAKTCKKAKGLCLKRKRFNWQMCLLGKAENHFKPCSYKLLSRKGKLLGVFTETGAFEDYNCKISKLKCELRKWFVRKCVKQ